jgi:hypothetical protein
MWRAVPLAVHQGLGLGEAAGSSKSFKLGSGMRSGSALQAMAKRVAARQRVVQQASPNEDAAQHDSSQALVH